MYSAMSGRMAASAPSRPKTGPMVSRPISERRAASPPARTTDVRAKRAARGASPSPNARATSDDAPTDSPMNSPTSRKKSAEEKLRAASSAVPSLPTNQVSTTWNRKVESMPRLMGADIANRARCTGATARRRPGSVALCSGPGVVNGRNNGVSNRKVPHRSPEGVPGRCESRPAGGLNSLW